MNINKYFNQYIKIINKDINKIFMVLAMSVRRLISLIWRNEGLISMNNDTKSLIAIIKTWEQMSWYERIILNQKSMLYRTIMQKAIVNCLPVQYEFLLPVVKIIPTRVLYRVFSSAMVFVTKTLARLSAVLNATQLN
jgi:hypothetical protein